MRNVRSIFPSARPIALREPLPRGEVFELLENRRRRYVLAYFRRRGSSTVPLQRLVEGIAVRENGGDPEAVEKSDRTAVYASLHQTHLPKLESADVVEYDRNERTVTLTDRGRQLTLHLKYVPEWGTPLSRIFVGLSLFWLLVLLIAWIDVSLPGRLPDLWLALACVATFLVVSTGYAWGTRRRISAGREPIDAPP